ncbi:amidohydrolase [Haloarcula japonica]|uniref:Metal dependent amidohydrolase superfamily protein n=1 Tax=Haloarcula japonica (strain ATCC 49778 / DSM 6131 / JCM 7785 / NBRC 101032 / NCIMB 13157 / TR-1) TaxID=1227453 RepID=M0L9S4_HALJT|nr:amidohydrolase [Haloarcula japonica]EMA28685.1 metal dependent amidohydrolase superfamily protein [Haloarcula japonica DSM 6131]
MVDRVFTNCEVRPLSGDDPASAVTVTDGTVTAVGDPDELSTASAETVDCRGGVLLPGFVDAHTHLDIVGRRAVEADLAGADGPNDCIDRLLAADDGEGWILGFGYDESDWDGTLLRAATLDRVSTERPVAAAREDIHTVSVNHAALDVLDLPDDGVQTEDGAPTGVLVEEAAEAVFDAVAPGYAQTREYLLAAQEVALSEGVTAVHDMVRQSHAPRVYRDLDTEDALSLRVRLNYWADHLDAIRELGLVTNHGSDRVRTGAIKTYIDGSLGAGTARLRAPYADSDSVGEWRTDPDALRELVLAVDDAGLQFAAHAIGDAAIDALLSAIESVDAADERHRVEHAEVLTGDLVERLAASPLVVSAQPNFHRWAAPGGLYDERLDERRELTNRFRDLLDADARLAFGSDCMPLSPLYGVQQAVTAPEPSQRLTVDEALRAYTSGAAYAGFDEDRMGTVAPGSVADFTVLSGSPWEVPDGEISDIPTTLTVSGGDVVFNASD